MAIDIGQSKKYRANFPTPGISQSSQPFRDNFSVLGVAVGNLQTAKSTTASVLNIVTNVNSSSGLVELNVGYNNNSFILPLGNPTITPLAGMVRYNLGRLEVYDGTTWNFSGGADASAAQYLLLTPNPTTPNARTFVAGTGIAIVDGGPGRTLTISAVVGAALGRIQVLSNGILVSERPSVDIVDSNEIIFTIEDDTVRKRALITAHTYDGGWFRFAKVNFGSVTDKYGNNLNMGTIDPGIINRNINLGLIG